MMGDRIRQILFSLRRYFTFFLLMSFIVTCCMLTFLTLMKNAMQLEPSKEQIHGAAVYMMCRIQQDLYAACQENGQFRDLTWDDSVLLMWGRKPLSSVHISRIVVRGGGRQGLVYELIIPEEDGQIAAKSEAPYCIPP